MQDSDNDNFNQNPAVPSVASDAALSVGKKKQIFKKEKAKTIKNRIQELKMQSKKLKKKKLDQKAEKKKIAKEIHRLKASLKANEEIGTSALAKDDSDEDDEMD